MVLCFLLQGQSKVKAQGLGVHKPEEIEEKGRKDLQVCIIPSWHCGATEYSTFIYSLSIKAALGSYSIHGSHLIHKVTGKELCEPLGDKVLRRHTTAGNYADDSCLSNFESWKMGSL